MKQIIGILAMKLIILVLSSLLTFPAFSQIKFIDNKTSWNDLSAQAKKEKKLIFIHFENSACQQCNEVASMAFNNPLLTEKFGENFVSIRLNVETENGMDFKSGLHIQGSLISVFTDTEGNILEMQNGSTSNPQAYAEKADLALRRRGARGINSYTQEYRAGSRSLPFLREYLVKLKELEMVTDEVLDEYTSQLPPDSLANFNTVRFIYQFGPALYSKTSKTVQQFAPRGLVENIYRSVPFSEAVEMNNGIVRNSMRNAVMKRDPQLAEAAARFAQLTYDRDPQMGKVTYEKNMLQYLYTTRDTAQYLNRAAQFVEQYYRPISIDSLKGMDQAELAKMKPPKMKPGENVTVLSFKLNKPSQYYPMELNTRARHFYDMATKKEDLELALSWSKLAMEWSEEILTNINNTNINGNPSYMETYAHLLYKLGRKEEALTWQIKALGQQKATSQPYGHMETALAKMKAGTL
ncbi:thioredoxin family protein [Dyadobacter sp. CY343]|uniref:thioredoxin family protein n=1 Tax=Dyadobacter sp. CY343 TaxID=2907299 RepID=UPI001F2EB0B7|nr:thioredoxin family protein [Dyadobacter sp. CY343]MCE7063277.1 thioredoxin family protein [Dyadobacter sp. CY343]